VLRLVLLTALLIATGLSRLVGLTPDDLFRVTRQLLTGHLGTLRGF